MKHVDVLYCETCGNIWQTADNDQLKYPKSFLTLFPDTSCCFWWRQVIFKQILTSLQCSAIPAQYVLLSFVCICVYVCMPSTIEMAPQIKLLFAYDWAHVSVAFVHRWHHITRQIHIHNSMPNYPKRCYWLSVIVITKWKVIMLWLC